MRCPICGETDPAAALGDPCPICDGVLVDPATAPDRFIGRRVDGFAIVDRLGAGGHGAVYRALHGPRRAVAALKLIPLDDDPRRRERFTREVAALRALADAAGPPLVGAGEARIDGRAWLYLARAHVAGTPLSAVLAEHRRLPPDAARDITDGVLARLAAAHAHGVVHRDLKPAHVLLTAADGRRRVDLLDFGIARIRAADDPGGALATLTTTGAVVGTPAYTAPEQIDARAPIGPATDLYAVGVMLHEMLTGARPFDGLDALAVLRAHLDRPPPPLDGPLAPVVARALAKHPADRWPSADAMRRALRPRRARRAALAVAAALTLAALALAR
ncbi:MAG: serine/threonine protein kinase [Myxococcales bacterium]|nr:serine/threonine protein kinase [Myxococcales bacterium]